MVDTARPLVHRLTAGAKGQSVVNLGLHLFSTGMGFVASVLTSRLLGAEGLGVYAFCFAVGNVLGVVGRLGLVSLVVREVAVARERKQWGLVHGMLRWAERSAVAASALLAVAVAALGWWRWSASDPSTARALAVVPLLVAATSAMMIRSAALQGTQRVVAGQSTQLAMRPAVFVLGLLLLHGLSATRPDAVLAAHAVGCLAAWCAGVWLWSRDAPPPAPAVVQGRRWLRAGLPLMWLAALSLITTQVDTLMLKMLAGNASTGLYSVAAQLAHFAGVVLAVINGVLAPRYAALAATGDTSELQRLVARGTAAIALGTLPVAVTLLVFGRDLLGLFGGAFPASYACMVLLVAGQVANAACGSVGSLLVMSGNEREVGRVTTGTALLNVALNALLIPSFGAEGAAAATSISLTTWNLVLVWRVRSRLGIDSTVLGALRLRGGLP